MRREEHRVAVEVAGNVAAVALDETVELGLVAGDPAADGKPRHLEIDRQAVFDVEAFLQHVELQCADDADDGRRAVLRLEQLHHAFLGHLLQRFLQLLRLHGVAEADAAQDFRREIGHAAEQDVLALGQRVADPERAVVGDADDVAGERLVGGDARAGEEELRRRQAHLLAGAHQLGLHAALQRARAHTHEGDAVAVVGVHVGLDLEDEGGHVRLGRLDLAGVGLLGARRRAEGAERLDQVADAEIAQGRAEEHRRQMALAERLRVERLAGLARQLQLLDEGGAVVLGQEPGDAVGIGPLTGVRSASVSERRTALSAR